MTEKLSEWVVVGEAGIRFGSFNQRERANEYCAALQRLRGLSCVVVHRDTVDV